MAAGCSFAEYVKDKCYNGLYQVAEEYVNSLTFEKFMTKLVEKFDF